MNDPETNPYRPTQERGGLSAKPQRVNTTLPLISGAAYATLSLIIFLAIATFGEALPVVAVLLLSIVIVPYYVTVMLMIWLDFHGIFECCTIGWIAAFLFAAGLHYMLQPLNIRS